MSEKSVLDEFKAHLDVHSQNRLHEQSNAEEILERKRSWSGFKSRLNEIGYICRLCFEGIKLHSFQRWKLREPLVYSTVFNMLDSKAYEPLF